MTYKEEIKAIIKAAPYLPRQAFNGLMLLIIIPVLVFKGFQELSINWTETKAKPIEISRVQERIKNDKPDFFFRVTYQYGAGSIHVSEESYPSEFMANNRIEILTKYTSGVPLWFSGRNTSTLVDPTSQWYIHFIIALFFLTLLAYFKWLLIKYYQLELAD